MGERTRLHRDESTKNDLINSLHDLITDLTLESNEPHYTDEEQQRIHRHAKEIRKRRITLRGIHFDRNTSGYQEATSALETVNSTIQISIDRINNLVSFFEDLAKLVAAIDRIIQAAVLL